MGTVIARAYLSPTLVLLAMDWPDGEKRNDFLGFAIKRTPGFKNLKTKKVEPSSWLPNRLGFNGPPPKGQPDFPSNKAPIQKFMWWDARLEGVTASTPISYEISAVVGTPNNLSLDSTTTTTVTVTLPSHMEHKIGTWFNRAVMSSQAFSRKLETFKKDGELSDDEALELRKWLANGMERPIVESISNAPSLAGAIYHLTDETWVIPALKAAMNNSKIGLVYDSHIDKKSGKCPNNKAIATLKKTRFFSRDKTTIMHNKYLVVGDNMIDKSNQAPKTLVCGSANYTTQGLTSQANLVHTFESPELASLYFERFELLKNNPTRATTAKESGWSRTVSVGDAGVRAFFSPEPGKPGEAESESIETIVEAIHAAKSSVLFCLFTPTDQRLRDACFSVGDSGKMMFGLVNLIANDEPDLTPTSTGKIHAGRLAALEIYHRSKDKKDVIGAEFFHADSVPDGFNVEINLFPGEKRPPYPPVIVHHKFIVIDAETDSPTIYTGSANMSKNSVFMNDENLLEIKGSPRLARIYLGEFMRLYEHYRARARAIAYKKNGAKAAGFALRKDHTWADAHYRNGTPESKARIRLLAVD